MNDFERGELIGSAPDRVFSFGDVFPPSDEVTDVSITARRAYVLEHTPGGMSVTLEVAQPKYKVSVTEEDGRIMETIPDAAIRARLLTRSSDPDGTYADTVEDGFSSRDLIKMVEKTKGSHTSVDVAFRHGGDVFLARLLSGQTIDGENLKGLGYLMTDVVVAPVDAIGKTSPVDLSDFPRGGGNDPWIGDDINYLTDGAIQTMKTGVNIIDLNSRVIDLTADNGSVAKEGNDLSTTPRTKLRLLADGSEVSLPDDPKYMSELEKRFLLGRFSLLNANDKTGIFPSILNRS